MVTREFNQLKLSLKIFYGDGFSLIFDELLSEN